MDFHRLLSESEMKNKIILFLLFLTINHYSQVQLGPIAGAVTETSAVILIKTYSSDQEVIIELFTQDDVENTIYSEAIITEEENYNYVKIPVNDLMPNTTYYYRAIVDEFPSRKWNSFQTFPEDKEYSFSFGFGSCQQSSWGKPDPEIFPVIANDTLRFFIQLGDWTYPDTTEKKYGYRFNEKMNLLEKSYQSKYSNNYPFVAEVLSQMSVVYTYDDHDFAANNSDGSDPAKGNSIWAYKTFFPHYELKNPDNGIWQSFTFGDVEFFVLDMRAQRNTGNDAFDENKNFNPPPGHSILAGYDISGMNQKEWFFEALKKSTAKWKVIVSSVLFNPAYAKTTELDSLPGDLWWFPSDAADKWAGYPEDVNALLNTIISNSIKNVFVISGDTHSSFIDDGKNSLIPEIGASNLDVNNSNLGKKLNSLGINIWNKGTYNEDGYTYGRVRFFFGEEDYALLEIINERKEIILSHRLDAE
jgi:phosphodiesterase/alkaline phosphatase D-like protein